VHAGWYVRCGQRTELIGLKRVQRYATVIAGCLWTIWLVDVCVPGPLDRLGKVKGTDFLHFYVIGAMARDGRNDLLYDARAQYDRSRAVVPGSDDFYLPVESPQTALVVAPLTRYPYTIALALWLFTIVVFYACCCWAMWRQSPGLWRYRYAVVASCIAFPGLYSAVLHGQTSFVGLAALTAALLAVRRGWMLTAGLALGVLAFKPHWLLAACAVFLAAREWRVVAGAITSAIAQVGITALVVGTSTMSAYVGVLRSLPRIAPLLEPRSGDSLKSFFTVFIPFEWPALGLYVAAAGATLVIAARIWRSDARFEIRFAAVILALILICPHVNAYDLILLCPLYFLLAECIADGAFETRRLALPLLLFASFLSPLLAALPAVIRLQFSVTAMAATLMVLRSKAA
jgi:alpha-1,2-mannosyltransferase